MGDVHVEGVVAAGLLIGPLPPLVVGLHQAAAGLRDHMIDCRGRTVKDREVSGNERMRGVWCFSDFSRRFYLVQSAVCPVPASLSWWGATLSHVTSNSLCHGVLGTFKGHLHTAYFQKWDHGEAFGANNRRVLAPLARFSGYNGSQHVAGWNLFSLYSIKCFDQYHIYIYMCVSIIYVALFIRHQTIKAHLSVILKKEMGNNEVKSWLLIKNAAMRLFLM